MSIEQLNKAMDDVNDQNKKGVSVQGGKKYTNVSTRVEVLRRHFGLDVGVSTYVQEFCNGVLVRAIVTKDEREIGSGHAFTTELNAEKCLEKTETTAIGRALAACGLAGGEYATQNEIDTWKERYDAPLEERDIFPVSKTGDKAIDKGLFGMAMNDIQGADTEQVAHDAGLTWLKKLKDAGCTEDQIGLFCDQVSSKKQELTKGEIK
jgi:hypothetical protein